MIGDDPIDLDELDFQWSLVLILLEVALATAAFSIAAVLLSESSRLFFCRSRLSFNAFMRTLYDVNPYGICARIMLSTAWSSQRIAMPGRRV